MNEYLNKNAELRLIKLGNRRYYRTLVLTVGWIVLVVVAWLCVMMGGKYSFARVPSYLPLLLCILPFFPFSASSVLFSKMMRARKRNRLPPCAVFRHGMLRRYGNIFTKKTTVDRGGDRPI